MTSTSSTREYWMVEHWVDSKLSSAVGEQGDLEESRDEADRLNARARDQEGGRNGSVYRPALYIETTTKVYPA